MVSRIATLLALALFGADGALAGQIQWRVEAGFAPFGYLSDPNVASSIWLPKNNDNGAITMEAWYNDLYKSGHLRRSPYAEWLGQRPASSPPWDRATGQYRSEYVHPVSTTIRARLDHGQGDCYWRVLRGGREVESLSISSKCAEEVKVKGIRLSGDKLTVESSSARAEVDVEIEHMVIVGLGDSYASGEGNPDIPTTWNPTSAPQNSFGWLEPRGRESLVARSAEWSDHNCHRSFFSYQSYVALRAAAENPHRLVTFLHYACSGAEILDGVVVSQYMPPGMRDNCARRVRAADGSVRRDDSACYLPRSQLASMIADLCAAPEEVDQETSGRIRAGLERSRELIAGSPNLAKIEAFNRRDFDIPSCGHVRQPDAVLLSIGGNDAGFAQLVAWAVFPQQARRGFAGLSRKLFRFARGRNVVCPAYGRGRNERCETTDLDLARQLPVRYAVLEELLEASSSGISRRVVLNSYPVAVTRPTEGGSQRCFDPPGCNPLNGWDGARMQLPSIMARGKQCTSTNGGWEFNIREGEVHSLVFKNAERGEATVPMIQAAVGRAAEKHQFRFAEAVGSAFSDQGFCRQDAGDMPVALPSRAPQMWRCPDHPGISGTPACWEAYKPAGRYIRTVNDSLLTMTSERDDAIAGTFHPTAQGHAAIADAVWPLMVDVLDDQ